MMFIFTLILFQKTTVQQQHIEIHRRWSALSVWGSRPLLQPQLQLGVVEAVFSEGVAGHEGQAAVSEGSAQCVAEDRQHVTAHKLCAHTNIYFHKYHDTQ